MFPGTAYEQISTSWLMVSTCLTLEHNTYIHKQKIDFGASQNVHKRNRFCKDAFWSGMFGNVDQYIHMKWHLRWTVDSLKNMSRGVLGIKCLKGIDVTTQMAYISPIADYCQHKPNSTKGNH